MSRDSRPYPLAIILPGMLLAATGVGAGDLLTSALAGSEAGLTVLWAAVAACILKWTLSEGIARWQMATGSTILEGWSWKLGAWSRWIFLIYLVLASMITGGALVTACGVAATGLIPLGDSETSRVSWGLLHSLLGVLLVLRGGFRLFERVMAISVGLMFVSVISMAAILGPGVGELLANLRPAIPDGGPKWVLAVVGGVGGSLTLLSYGYWIDEKGRKGRDGLRKCRIDLAAAYVLTALFGMSVIVIGSTIEIQGSGSAVGLQMADRIAAAGGNWMRWVFLVGFWAAVFSSLLGVWQSLPYLFADFVELRSRTTPGIRRQVDLSSTPAYRAYLVFLLVGPLLFLWTPVREVQLLYGVLGALFLPFLAVTLLILNNRRTWVGTDFRSPFLINALLAVALGFFGFVGLREAFARLAG